MNQADRLRVAMKFKLDRIVSIATLLASLLAIFLVLKKPAPVAQPPQRRIVRIIDGPQGYGCAGSAPLRGGMSAAVVALGM